MGSVFKNILCSTFSFLGNINDRHNVELKMTDVLRFASVRIFADRYSMLLLFAAAAQPRCHIADGAFCPAAYSFCAISLDHR